MGATERNATEAELDDSSSSPVNKDEGSDNLQSGGGNSSGSGEESEGVSNIEENIKNDLLHYLDTFKDSETFAAFNPLQEVVNPDLCVQNVGDIGLPLTDQSAAAIVQPCHQAPFGRGSDTVIDTAVRNT